MLRGPLRNTSAALDSETIAMAYTVPDLPYAFDALEPHIDAQTMQIHHDKHHAAYVTNLNNAIQGTDLGNQPIEDAGQEYRQGAGKHSHRGP